MRLLSIIFSIVLLAFANAANAQLSLDAAKGKCVELGFKAGTEEFGKCVLQLSKVEEVKPAPQQVQPPVQTYTPLPKPGTFFIQVVTLADGELAKRVQQRIIDVGSPAYLQNIPAGNGSVTRVRAGPFATRKEAEEMQAKLQGAGFEGRVASVP